MLITQEAFAEHKVSNRLNRYLRRRRAAVPAPGGRHAGATRPDIVLLDLNLPGVDGRAVLEAIHADPALQRHPAAVVLTSSRAEEDFLRSHELQVDTYISKPVDFTSLMHVVRRIETFYISVRNVTA